MLNDRVTSFIESLGLLGEEQAGFRSGYSTMDHIFSLHAIFDWYLKRRKRVYTAFVHYKKAFDLIDRSSLWLKLIDNGINGKLLRVVKDIYKKSKSCVSYNNSKLIIRNAETKIKQSLGMIRNVLMQKRILCKQEMFFVKVKLITVKVK